MSLSSIGPGEVGVVGDKRYQRRNGTNTKHSTMGREWHIYVLSRTQDIRYMDRLDYYLRIDYTG